MHDCGTFRLTENPEYATAAVINRESGTASLRSPDGLHQFPVHQRARCVAISSPCAKGRHESLAAAGSGRSEMRQRRRLGSY